MANDQKQGCFWVVAVFGAGWTIGVLMMFAIQHLSWH